MNVFLLKDKICDFVINKCFLKVLAIKIWYFDKELKINFEFFTMVEDKKLSVFYWQ